MARLRDIQETINDLKELRENNFDHLSIADNSLFDMLIHEIEARQPGHPADCDACCYYGWSEVPCTHGLCQNGQEEAQNR